MVRFTTLGSKLLGGITESSNGANNLKWEKAIKANIDFEGRLFKEKLSSVDFQLIGSNLCVWDDVDLWDPEQAYLNGRAYPILPVILSRFILIPFNKPAEINYMTENN